MKFKKLSFYLTVFMSMGGCVTSTTTNTYKIIKAPENKSSEQRLADKNKCKLGPTWRSCMEAKGYEVSITTAVNGKSADDEAEPHEFKYNPPKSSKKMKRTEILELLPSQQVFFVPIEPVYYGAEIERTLSVGRVVAGTSRLGGPITGVIGEGIGTKLDKASMTEPSQLEIKAITESVSRKDMSEATVKEFVKAFALNLQNTKLLAPALQNPFDRKSGKLNLDLIESLDEQEGFVLLFATDIIYTGNPFREKHKLKATVSYYLFDLADQENVAKGKTLHNGGAAFIDLGPSTLALNSPQTLNAAIIASVTDAASSASSKLLVR